MSNLFIEGRAGISLLAMALFLSGCAAGPSFEKPSAPVVTTYTSGTQVQNTAAVDGSGVGEQILVNGKDVPGAWWELFQSEPLNQLIRQSLKSNPDIQMTEASLREAQNNLYAGEGAFLPSIDATGSGSRNKTSGRTSGGSGQGSIYNLYNASVGVSYTLDLFGGTRRAVEALDAYATYQRFQVEGAYLSLTSNIVTTAMQEASLRAQVDATREIADAQRKQLEMVSRQFALGAVSRTAVLTQQSTLASTEASLPTLQKQLAQTRHSLSVLAGQFPSEEILATFDLDSIHMPKELPLSLPSKLVEQRPDVQAAEALLHQASANIGIATANMLPKITLSADLGSAAKAVGDLLNPGSGVWNLAGAVSQPLFEGGSLFFKREAAKDAYDAAAASYRSTVLTAFQNVADTLKALEMDTLTLKARQDAERAASASLDIATRQFNSGAISYLNLLTAQQTYQNAKIAYVQARAARYADVAALYQALGGGWWNRTDDATDADSVENKATEVHEVIATTPAPKDAGAEKAEDKTEAGDKTTSEEKSEADQPEAAKVMPVNPAPQSI